MRLAYAPAALVLIVLVAGVYRGRQLAPGPIGRSSETSLPPTPTSAPAADLSPSPATPPPPPTPSGPSLRERLDRSKDYAKLVDDIADRAKAGDPEAQYVTYRALNFCADFRKVYLPKVGGRTRTIDEALAKRARQPMGPSFEVLNEWYERCRTLLEDPSRVASIAGAGSWLDAAAGARYPAALSDKAATIQTSELLVRAGTAPDTSYSPNMQRALDMAIEAALSGDPRAVFVMSDWVSGENRTIEQAAVLISAWEIRACQMGYDCGANSDFMSRVCMLDPQCAQGQTYVDYFQRGLGTQYDEALILALQIGSAISSKDTAAIKALL